VKKKGLISRERRRTEVGRLRLRLKVGSNTRVAASAL
jgi:hypothetical protein